MKYALRRGDVGDEGEKACNDGVSMRSGIASREVVAESEGETRGVRGSLPNVARREVTSLRALHPSQI